MVADVVQPTVDDAPPVGHVIGKQCQRPGLIPHAGTQVRFRISRKLLSLGTRLERTHTIAQVAQQSGSESDQILGDREVLLQRQAAREATTVRKTIADDVIN